MSQWEESCAESSDSVCSTDKSTVATYGCNSVAEALIGKDGGILMLPNAATSLLFSPHSISNQIDITLEIPNNPVVLPELREDETLVSPCVFCGPHGWTFHKPVLLTFPHCGMSDRDDFTLLVTETSSQQAPDWMEVSSDTPGIEYFVRDSECLVYTSHFTGFSLKSKGPKQVRLLAFSSLSDNLYRLRVYCISDTKDVVDRIKKEEQEFGFKQTDRGVSMTFLNNKHNLHLRAHLETPGWKFLNSSELVISYESVRRKRDSNVLFKLQAEPEHKKGTAILSLSISAFQDGNSDSPTYSIAEELPVATGQTEMRKLGPTSCDHKGACNSVTQILATSSPLTYPPHLSATTPPCTDDKTCLVTLSDPAVTQILATSSPLTYPPHLATTSPSADLPAAPLRHHTAGSNLQPSFAKKITYMLEPMQDEINILQTNINTNCNSRDGNDCDDLIAEVQRLRDENSSNILT
ncbi:hypothetical protein Bbelb_321810 [Branchiostoma belcheri]|nr:hypothetical protein Bbelb_321810 [Branchiostoma belcheri]